MSKLFIEDTTLTSIGDAIRTKAGTTEKIAPLDMPAAIEAIKSGAENQELNVTSNGTYTAPEGVGYSPVKVNVPQDGAPTAEELTITGNCGYKFANDGWNWIINKYGNQITTNNISNCDHMFDDAYHLKKIPFDINCDAGSDINCNSMFSSTALEAVPRFSNCKISGMDNMFNGSDIREFPQDFEKGFDFTLFDNSTSSWSNYQQGRMFDGMHYLRKLPLEFIKHGNPQNGYYYTYYTAFTGLYVLDEIYLPNPYYKAKWTSNAFQYSQYCYHLKDYIFASTMTNGEPNNPKWSNQSINLQYQIGYGNVKLSDYGVPAEKEIKDDATYQQFKDDPDAWTRLQEYSRYNHDSAVRTINSLPDTSAFIASNGGTNTIKFNGANGSKTDGGAINTLTEAEIAVAAAKGWTVTLA